MIVEAYRNLQLSAPRAAVWSVRRVWPESERYNVTELELRDCAFVIDEPERLEFLATGRTSVHAWVRGTIAPAPAGAWRGARFRPGAPAFDDDSGGSLLVAAWVKLDAFGLWFREVVE